MKKWILILPLAVVIFVAVIFINGKAGMSSSESYKDNEQVYELINKYSEENGYKFELATKEIEKSLSGKWQVGDTLGYSLKYDITGGALDYAVIDITKDTISVSYSDKTFEDPSVTQYEQPVFLYYNETLEQMAKDELLDNYSGIEGMAPETEGTIIVAININLPDQEDEHDLIPIKFILIDDYVIAVNMSSFYQLQRVE